jgi:hypothetical protein
MVETRRRTLVKTVAWRLIGIAWTWIGAYLILLFTPDRYRSAAVLSTFIVAFHHSTRMAMYYGYERAWGAIAWGKCEPGSSLAGPVSWRARVAWTMLAVAAVVLILLIVLYVTPLVKP